MNKNISNEILSDITVHMKYAKYNKAKNRRETWKEVVDRNKKMHLKKFPELTDQIEWAYTFVYEKKVLPSMRSIQFAGKPIEISPNRLFNCAYTPVDDWRVFHEIMFLLLGGSGVGFSVQEHHIEKLPEITRPNPKRNRRYLIGDSIEGWADAIKALIKSYFFGGSTIRFDFSDIRPKGAELVTSGGKAPGPQPLKECIIKIKGMLEEKDNGDQLTSIEVHDIICHIADAVLAGGIRRAALISLFSAKDGDMLSAKAGMWWETNPQRGRANNSAVLVRSKITKDFFLELGERIEASNAGEPGIFFTNDKDVGTNPCCLDADTLIDTDNGKIPIAELITLHNSGAKINIKSYNVETGEVEYCEMISGAMTRENANVICLELENGEKLTLTPDHLVYTENRGYVMANKLEESDIILYL